MKYTSIFEKIICLFQVLKNSWASLIFLGVTFFLFILMARKKISKKTCSLLVLVGYLILLGCTCFWNFNQLSKVADSIMNRIFTDLYFPSAYVYLFVLIFLNVVALGGILNRKKEKVYKMIHGVCLFSMNFTFILILNLISDNKIDVFTKTSLFSNTNLVTLLELSINICILWLVGLFITYLTNQITERIVITREDAVLKKAPAVMETVSATVDSSQLEEEYLTSSNSQINQSTSSVSTKLNEVTNVEAGVYTYQFIPPVSQNSSMKEVPSSFNQQIMFEQAFQQRKNTTNEKSQNVYSDWNTSKEISSNTLTDRIEDTFDLNSFIPKKQMNLSNNQENNNLILEQILKNNMPIIKEDSTNLLAEQEKNTYTLNDYRIFNKMLKDIKEHNQSNIIQIDKNLEYRLITKYSNETYLMFKRMLKNYSN